MQQHYILYTTTQLGALPLHSGIHHHPSSLRSPRSSTALALPTDPGASTASVPSFPRATKIRTAVHVSCELAIALCERLVDLYFSLR